MSRTNQILAAYAIESPRTSSAIGKELELPRCRVATATFRLACRGDLICTNPGVKPMLMEITTRGRQRLADAIAANDVHPARPSVGIVQGALSGRSMLAACWGGA